MISVLYSLTTLELWSPYSFPVPSQQITIFFDMVTPWQNRGVRLQPKFGGQECSTGHGQIRSSPCSSFVKSSDPTAMELTFALPHSSTIGSENFMSKSRREFLTKTSLGLLAAATVYRSHAQ